jgi:transcriptional regulator of acetoin/glycerol metabolism
MESGQCPDGLVAGHVSRSWQRSLSHGLQPVGRLDLPDPTDGAPLRRALAVSHDLIAHSTPVMEYLYEQVRHSASVVALADRAGMLVHTLGDADFVSRAERVALRSGSSWHEQHRGTNAIGTALAEDCAVEIHGAEHFLERNAFLTCAAAPIASATGELLGILDISGDQRHGHPHTLGLVSTAARMIENRLLAATCRRELRLHLHPQPEGIGTLAEGVIALSGDGWIVGANRAALALLRLRPADLRGTPLDAVAETALDTLLARARQRPGEPQPLRLHDGRLLHAQLQTDPRTLSAPARSAWPGAARPAAPASGVADDALARLDTGDARWSAAADKARRVLGKPIALLIQGESGVGKELFARAVHDSGPRRAGPFVAINCAAVPEHLIEAELFGYTGGAFTGARREGSPGRLRDAHGGTLFLDEIGDMPLPLQTRLLRVLQERQVTPLGGGAPVDVDFTLVCATHHPLREEAAAGRFRSDLYWRINGLTVQLPPLRERGDFDALTARLLADLNPGRTVCVAPDLAAALRRHGWPGNLRQYASVLRTASALLGPDEDTITWTHLADDTAEDLQGIVPQPPAPAAGAPAAAASAAPRNLQELSRAVIRQTLEHRRGNVSQAARDLGISRQTMYRKLRDSAEARQMDSKQ